MSMDFTGRSLEHLICATAGVERSQRLFRILLVPDAMLLPSAEPVATRAVIAQALNMLLFEDLIARVPAAALYVERALANGATILHDHGAVRTVDLDGMGTLPRGREAILRLLRPLGYELRGTYPLDRLKMTGRSYAQAEYPEQIAQFFISELHVDRFDEEFQATVRRVTISSSDPLTPAAAALLDRLEAAGSLTLDEAAKLLPVLVRCFDRQHAVPALSDYERLLRDSAEMAWIATEGNAFNHATDRVDDIEALTREQKALGQPMKDKVEVSGSGRVRQTAFHAAKISRQFVLEDGTFTEREVPGSFLEFIARDYVPGDEQLAERPTLDLSFDPSNAQAIFKMTASERP